MFGGATAIAAHLVISYLVIWLFVVGFQGMRPSFIVSRRFHSLLSYFMVFHRSPRPFIVAIAFSGRFIRSVGVS